MAKAVFGAGCFWGVEKKFSDVKGVTSTEVGYSQGKNSKTSYEEVCTGTTDHVEVVLVEYEEDKVTYENLVHLNKNPEIIDRSVGPWLKKRQLRVLKKQIEFFCQVADTLIASGDNPSLFTPGNDEERKRGWN